MDAIDIQILEILQDDARKAKAEIARLVGLTPTAVFERIRKLERDGFVTGYKIELDPEAFGYPMVAFVFLSHVAPANRVETGELLARIPGVEEVHKITGSEDFVLKVRASGTEALARILEEDIGAIPSVTQTRTSIVLSTVVEGKKLPLSGD